jgi:hypothetical protein
VAQPNFFFRFLVAITFPLDFDVWGRFFMYTWRGCESHDFAPVSQHFRGEKENLFLFFLKGRASREEGS